MASEVRKAAPDSMSSGSSSQDLDGLTPKYKVPIIMRLTDKLNIERHLVACVICEFFCSFFLMVSTVEIVRVRFRLNRLRFNSFVGLILVILIIFFSMVVRVSTWWKRFKTSRRKNRTLCTASQYHGVCGFCLPTILVLKSPDRT